jgi:hypothetical protein
MGADAAGFAETGTVHAQCVGGAGVPKQLAQLHVAIGIRFQPRKCDDLSEHVWGHSSAPVTQCYGTDDFFDRPE